MTIPPLMTLRLDVSRFYSPADFVGSDEPLIRFVTPEMANKKLDEALHYIDQVTQDYHDAGMPEKDPSAWSHWILFRRDFRSYYDEQYNSVFDASSVYTQAEDYIVQAEKRVRQYEKEGWTTREVAPEIPKSTSATSDIKTIAIAGFGIVVVLGAVYFFRKLARKNRPMSYERLNTWFLSGQKLLVKKFDPPSRATEIVIFHMGSKKATMVGTVDIPENEVEPSNLAVKAYELAQNDAQGMQRVGPQTYFVRIRYGSHLGDSRCTFRLTPETGDDAYDEDQHDEGMTEPPTNSGLTTQLMRHNEAILRILVASQAQTTSALQRQNELLEQRVNKSDKLYLETLDLFASLRLEMIKNNEERDQRQLENKWKSSILERVLPLTESVGMRLLGYTPKMATDAVGSFIESLNPEQLNAILPLLTDEQRTHLALVAESYMKTKEKEKNT